MRDERERMVKSLREDDVCRRKPRRQLHFLHSGEQELCLTPKGSSGGVCRLFCKCSV